MQSVVETAAFVADAKTAGVTNEEKSAIITILASNPLAGDAIPGTGGARKLRFAARGKGKSGGYRVITFFAGEDIPVFLLNVFAKGDRVDLTQAERNQLRKELAGLADDYRSGVRNYAQRS